MFSALAYYLVFTSAMEFMCARTSMKGLLIGLIYSFVEFSIAVNGLRQLYQIFPQYNLYSTMYCEISAVVTAIVVIFFFNCVKMVLQ